MTKIEELRAQHAAGGLTSEAIETEIQERIVTIGHLIGWLYPSILRSEVSELYEMLQSLRAAMRNPSVSDGQGEKPDEAEASAQREPGS